ncbi:YqzK family protein [Bacillus sp. B-jedd]|uniref:YqzK family protein n=1 Tax=Bacillus sp. B-jedd TaxID=1476857 RepID=UPI0005155DD8|nr:YqzK family protein [Bacillus sp. B-jedd]CEG27725.1 putative membrane protein yqzK [Bacillus sp. B-jedd]
MVSFCKAVYHTMKVLILFIASTLLFYYGMMWIHEEYQNYHRYDKPKGAAVKVFNPGGTENPEWLDRLVLFYKSGE